MTREELFNKWRQLGFQIQSLGAIVKMDTVSRDDLVELHIFGIRHIHSLQNLLQETEHFVSDECSTGWEEKSEL